MCYNSDENFITIKATIESNKQDMRTNKQDSDEKMIQFTVKFETMLAVISNQLKTLASSLSQKYTSNTTDPTTVVSANRRAPILDGVHSTKIGAMLTLKHKIISPKLYKLLTKIEPKGDTDLNLNNFYNHINMCFNAVTRL